MPRKKIQAIFFDIDDTLCATSEFTKEARQNALNAMLALGLKMPISFLKNELNQIVTEFSSNYSQHFNKLLERIPPESYENINPAILIAAAVNSYHYTKFHKLKTFDDVIPFLKKIANYPIIKGIISDGLAIKQAQKLLLLDIYSYFTPQAIFISEQVGISKIDPKIYEYICEKMKILPEQTMFIGDHPDKDIDTANQIGLISVRIRKNGKYDIFPSKTPPCYEIKTFTELDHILELNYEFISTAI